MECHHRHKQTLSTLNTTSFSWSLGDQINRVLLCQWLGYFEKSLLTLKETIAKTQTATTTSNYTAVDRSRRGGLFQIKFLK